MDHVSTPNTRAAQFIVDPILIIIVTNGGSGGLLWVKKYTQQVISFVNVVVREGSL